MPNKYMINKIIGKLKSSPFAKKYIEPIITSALEETFEFDKSITGFFIDSSGRKHELYSGLRNKIKPGWQTMLQPENTNRIPSVAELKLDLCEAKRNLKNFKRILNSYDVDLKNKSVLEIGCYNGMKTFLLGSENCLSVTGSDISFYYENQSTANDKQGVNNYLSNLRGSVLNLFSDTGKKLIGTKVKFVEDDISKSSLENNSYDIIASWETLEHINDIGSAFSNIHRILKPNGIAVHEYNPFFSLNGGHSLCTLDFPWGHCRLNENDFSRYLHELRPAELQLAQQFYLNSLNRMTINNLRKASDNADLHVLALIPFVKKAHLTIYNDSYYLETKQNYQSVEPMDLISPVVLVIHQKK